MSKNIVKPRSVSFEDALRNLASRLTGRPAAELPRTQEGIVQFMAENVPTLDEMAEAVTQEVLARLEAATAAPDKEGKVPGLDEMAEAVTQEVLARMVESGSTILAATEPAEEPQDGSDGATEGTEKPKTTHKPKAKADK